MERWLPISGFDGLYEVSDLGRVRSLDRVLPYERVDQYSGRVLKVHRKRKGQMLQPGRKPSGHVSVALGRGNSKDVHVLVLEAFVGPCPEGCEALHDNDVPDDNRLGNLKWGTRTDNLLDAVRNGRKPVGEKHPFAKLSSEDVTRIKALLPTRSALSLARDYGVSGTTIRQIKIGKCWKHVA